MPGDSNFPNSEPTTEEMLRRILASLDEIRGLLLISDEERRAKARELADAHRRQQVVEAARLVTAADWARADQAITHLEDQFPDDPDVAGVRTQYREALVASEGAAFETLRARVEDLMALSSFDQALAAATRFVDSYPHSEEGRLLVSRVAREAALFRDSNARRLYQEVKDEMHRRQWRRALAAAQRLLEKFPEHPKAVAVREQIKVLQDNAEIEERQDMEARIRELIHAKRYADALELAEELMTRFPRSPQAKLLQELVPKLRGKAIEDDALSSLFGPDDDKDDKPGDMPEPKL